MEKRNAEFRDISSRYEHNKKQLIASFDKLLRKFQVPCFRCFILISKTWKLHLIAY